MSDQPPPPPPPPPPEGTGVWGAPSTPPASPPPPPPPPPGWAAAPPSPGGWGGAPAPASYAGFWARLAALLIDALIIGVAPWLVAGVLFGAGVGECTTVEGPFGETLATTCSGGSTLLVLLGLAVLFLGTILLAWFVRVRPIAEGGQSPGQKVASIRVVDLRTGAPGLGVGRAWGRFLFAYFVSSLVCYLGYLWMLWDDRDQTWHDKVVDSVVIQA